NEDACSPAVIHDVQPVDQLFVAPRRQTESRERFGPRLRRARDVELHSRRLRAHTDVAIFVDPHRLVRQGRTYRAAEESIETGIQPSNLKINAIGRKSPGSRGAVWR